MAEPRASKPMEALLGTLGVAVVTAVLAFAREQVKNSREDVKWYREELLPTLQRQQGILEELNQEVHGGQR